MRLRLLVLALVVPGLALWLGCATGGPVAFAIASTSPADNATSVSANATVRFVFSRAANPATLQYTCVPAAAFTASWNAGNTELTLAPTAALALSTAYTMTLTALSNAEGTESLAGSALHFTTSAGAGDVSTRLFFLHHSVGAGIIGGGMREWIATYNGGHGTQYGLWDHGYVSDGLTDADGNATGTDYGAPTDNTNPDGLEALWTSADADCTAARNAILDNYGVIAFKPCFIAIESLDAPTLATYQTQYLAMRSVFDLHADRIFVVVTPPPAAHGATTPASASNARTLAEWLGSATYLSGHPNVRCFDLFDVLANPDNGAARANMLRDAYLGDASGIDSHPNQTGYEAAAPLLAEFLVDTAAGG